MRIQTSFNCGKRTEFYNILIGICPAKLIGQIKVAILWCGDLLNLVLVNNSE